MSKDEAVINIDKNKPYLSVLQIMGALYQLAVSSEHEERNPKEGWRWELCTCWRDIIEFYAGYPCEYIETDKVTHVAYGPSKRQ